MSQETESFDRSELHALASAVMDGWASVEEQQALTEMLRSSNAARDEYLKYVDLHAALATDMVTAGSSDGSPELVVANLQVEPASEPPRRWRAIAGTLAALAAGLLLIVSLTQDGSVKNLIRSFDIKLILHLRLQLSLDTMIYLKRIQSRVTVWL